VVRLPLTADNVRRRVAEAAHGTRIGGLSVTETLRLLETAVLDGQVKVVTIASPIGGGTVDILVPTEHIWP
jgi:hypothetical protein